MGGIEIVNICPDFFLFWEEAKDKDLSTQFHLWDELYEGRHREIFDIYYRRWGKREELEQALERYPEIIGSLRSLLQSIEDDISDSWSKVSSLLEFEPSDLNLVLLVGSFTSNGWTTDFRGQHTAFCPLECFSSRQALQVTLLHELAHVAHSQILATCYPQLDREGDDFHIAPNLMKEGLATMSSKLSFPNYADAFHLWLGAEDFDAQEWLRWCERNEQAIFRRALGDLEKSDQDTYPAYFGNGTIMGQRRLGYYIGFKAIEHLLGEQRLGQLARLHPDSLEQTVRRAIEGMVEKQTS